MTLPYLTLLLLQKQNLRPRGGSYNKLPYVRSLLRGRGRFRTRASEASRSQAIWAVVGGQSIRALQMFLLRELGKCRKKDSVFKTLCMILLGNLPAWRKIISFLEWLHHKA